MPQAQKFRTRKAAESAAEECKRQGWLAGVIGSGPYLVDAIGHANGGRVLIRYELCSDGQMREYSRKEIAP